MSVEGMGGVWSSLLSDVEIRISEAKDREAQLNAEIQARYSGPGGFTLDRAEAERMVEQAIGVRADLFRVQERATLLEKVNPPAQDPVSASANQAVTWNGSTPGAFAYGSGHVRLEILYLDELIKRLNKALGRIAESDEGAQGRIENVEVDGGMIG